jgi:hypothetical protein
MIPANKSIRISHFRNANCKTFVTTARIQKFVAYVTPFANIHPEQPQSFVIPHQPTFKLQLFRTTVSGNYFSISSFARKKEIFSK